MTDRARLYDHRLYRKRCMPVLYTSREGGDWHAATISPHEYLTSFRTGRFGALTVVAMRLAHSCLIYDHILARAGYHPWRILESWPISESATALRTRTPTYPRSSPAPLQSVAIMPMTLSRLPRLSEWPSPYPRTISPLLRG